MSNPQLLELARVAAGRTQGQLARSLGKTQPFISQVERGERDVPRDLYESWARECEVPPGFLRLDQGPLSESLAGMVHRRMKTLPAKPFNRAIATVKLAALALDALFSEVEVVPAAEMPPISPGATGASAAAAIRRAWRVPDGPLPDLIGLIESAGIPVVAIDSFHEKQSATSHRGRWYEWMIAFNQNHPASRQRFTIAHELGHIVMNHDAAMAVDDESASEMEREADSFASSLLMPLDDAQRELRNPTFARLVLLKQRWKVSVAFLIRRALDTGMINPGQRKRLEIELSTQPGGRRREPAEFDHERPTLVRRLIEALCDDGLSIGEVADLMSVTETVLRERFLDEPRRLRAVESTRRRTIVELTPS